MIAVAAPAAPVVPAAGITAALILLAFVWVVLYGLKYGYDYSLGALLRKLADSTRGIRWIGGKIAAVFDDIDHFIQARIADGIDSVERSVARLWDGLAWLVREMGDALFEFGGDVHDAIYAIVNADIPAQVRAGTAPIDTRLDQVNRRTNAQARAEALARARGIDAVNRDLTREALARERGIDYIATRLDTIVMPGIRALDRTLDQVIGYTRRTLNRRLSQVEKFVLGGALAAAAVAALDLRFPFWKCSNVRRFNRMLCRSPIGGLDWLFALSALSVVAVDPRAVARAGQELVEAAGSFLRELADV